MGINGDCRRGTTPPKTSVNFFNSHSQTTFSLLEVRKGGASEYLTITRDQFITDISQYRLPLRDLRQLLRSSEPGQRSRCPVLLPRPSSSCFIFEVEHIKLICFSDRCLIFNPDTQPVQRFARELNYQFRSNSDHSETKSESSPRTVCLDSYIRALQDQDFEHVILETALANVVHKFRRHITIKKPALEMLLQQIEQDPETNGLKRLLAVKKSLVEFENRVEHVSKVVKKLLVDDEDLIELYLSNPERDKQDNDEIKLILEAYLADLDEIETETKIFTDMIEDTDQFISAHLDSVRNEIIKMSLFIEIGALVMASGAVVSGIFGMNLHNNLEQNSYAFTLVCIGIVLMMFGFFAGFYKKYVELRGDTSSAHSFTLLKNFFTYVDDLEYHVFNKKTLTSLEFREAVEKITKLKISEKESEYLFTMFDSNNDGLLDTEDELNLQIEQRQIV